MANASSEKRKARPAARRTSALHALKASGLIGLFEGPADLASSRKRRLKDKLRGKTGAAG